MSFQKSKIQCNRLQGKIGEEIGLKYFLERKYLVIVKNFKTRFGEIDLVLKKNNKIYFIEFKTIKKNISEFDLEIWKSKQLKNMIFVIKVMVAKNLISVDNFLQIELVVIDLSRFPKVVLKRNKYELANHDF